MEKHITKSELQILHVLWEAGVPLQRGGILEQSKDKTWKDSSIHILLNSMLEKGIIKEAGFSRSGKVFARLYAPTFTLEEYYISQLKTVPPSRRTHLLAALISQEPLSLKDIAVIEATLHAKKEGVA